MARCTFSLGILAWRALPMAMRRAALSTMFGPPTLAETMISRAILVKILPRLASAAPFARLMVDHLECPDMWLLTRVGLAARRF